MGLGLSVVSKIPKRSWFRGQSRTPDMCETIRSAAYEVAHFAGVEFLTPQFSGPLQDSLPLNYCEEWLDLTANEKTVEIFARTTSCGPGYHALVCDVVDALNSKHGFSFEETDDLNDETGYFQTRDFAALQLSHAEWLRGLARLVIEKKEDDGVESLRLSMPIDAKLPVGVGRRIITPRGPVTLGFLVELAESDEASVLRLAEGWFPWWNRVPTGGDFRKLGTQLLWTDVPWHVPADIDEHRVMSSALECFDRAQAAGESIGFLEPETCELRKLLTSGADYESSPEIHGIGYQRGLCTWSLGSGWSVELPGYWYEEINEGAQQIFFGDKSIHCSSLTVERKEGSVDKPIQLGNVKDDEIVVEEFSQFNLNYQLVRSSRSSQGLPVEYHLTVARNDGLLVMTFTSSDASWQKDIAVISRSVRSTQAKGFQGIR